MASLIANEFTEAEDDLHLSALIAVGFVLLLIALATNLAATWVLRRMSLGEGRK